MHGMRVDIVTTCNVWRTVEQLTPGRHRLISLQPWQLGANLDRVAARHPVRGDILAVDVNIIGSVRITLQVGTAKLTREFRPGTTFAVEETVSPSEISLANVGATDETRTITPTIGA